ncbi:MAG: hypothetical protein AABO41_17435 [Acidobacteriota bacterium]
MPMVGITGLDIGVVGIGTNDNFTYAATIDFPSSYVVSEIAMTSVATTDFGGGDSSSPLLSIDHVRYGIQQVVSDGIPKVFPNGQEPTIDGSPNVTSVTFFVAKNGSITSMARAFVSFWE